MDWKQFLKPDWRKIVLFLVLLNFVPMPLVCYYALGGCGEMFIVAGFIFFLTVLMTPLIMIVIAIPLIILSYLLSCLIIWIYDKFKGKKK